MEFLGMIFFLLFVILKFVMEGLLSDDDVIVEEKILSMVVMLKVEDVEDFVIVRVNFIDEVILIKDIDLESVLD